VCWCQEYIGTIALLKIEKCILSVAVFNHSVSMLQSRPNILESNQILKSESQSNRLNIT